jgi:hypothetical protein
MMMWFGQLEQRRAGSILSTHPPFAERLGVVVGIFERGTGVQHPEYLEQLQSFVDRWGEAN